MLELQLSLVNGSLKTVYGTHNESFESILENAGVWPDEVAEVINNGFIA